MHRAHAYSLLLLLAGGPLAAQAPATAGTALRLGGGITRTDLMCDGCVIDAQTGVAGFLAASRSIASGLTAGLELTFSDASFDVGSRGSRHAKLFGPMATAGVRRGSRVPVWGTLGFGWLWYSGIGPSSNGLGVSLRAGVDLRIGSVGFLTPYAGFVTMAGHDGPEVGVGDLPFVVEPTRLSSFQPGIALTLEL